MRTYIVGLDLWSLSLSNNIVRLKLTQGWEMRLGIHIFILFNWDFVYVEALRPLLAHIRAPHKRNLSHKKNKKYDFLFIDTILIVSHPLLSTPLNKH